MKKFIAILLMITMIFSCSAMAEITKDGTKTVLQVNVNPMLVDTEDPAVAMLIETINAMTLTVVEGAEMTQLNIGANGIDFLEAGLAADENGALLTFSSLYPNVAVKYDLSKLAAMLMEMVGEDVQMALTQGMAMGEQLVGALAGYVEDVMTLSALMESEMVIDEAAGTVALDITTHHVATLVNAWVARLQQDPQTLGMIEMLLAMAAEGEEVPALAEQLQAVKTEMDAALADEPVVLGSVKGTTTETGMKIEMTMMGILYMGLDVAMTDAMTVDLVYVIADEVTEDIAAQIPAILEGTAAGTVMGMKYAMTESAETAKLYVSMGGAVMAINVKQETANADTDAQVVNTTVSLDLEMGEMVMPMVGIAAETTVVDAPALPDLNAMYVYDVFAMPTDMLMNGIPQFIEKISAALPEVVQMIESAFAGMGEIVIPTNPEVNEIEDWTPAAPVETEEVAPAPVGGSIEDM